jgi:hypothetical protein
VAVVVIHLHQVLIIPDREISYHIAAASGVKHYVHATARKQYLVLMEVLSSDATATYLLAVLRGLSTQ